ncbi:MAG: hypothetical protein QF535_16310 [Anaerolineales bacterium]|jgi:hypothetical protein|nr:hypothetical protein [Anaerolineales bacterium]|tara:strand:+ start:908 stop:2485 length:1578 start_codon:yes stop_codon:yes gene_type:complete
MKLWEKVNNLCGCGGKSRILVEHLNQAAKWVVNSLPEKFLWTVSSTSSVTASTGSSVAYDKILAVYRDDGDDGKRIASEVPDTLAYAFDTSYSLNGATSMFPKYYKLDGKIWIKPDPTVASAGTVVYAAPPIVDENTSSWVLVEWENIVLMYAGALDFLRQSETKQALSSTELSTISTLLSTYNSSFPSYSSPAAPALPTYSFSGTLPTLTISATLPDSLAPDNTISYTAPTAAVAAASLTKTITVGTSLPVFNLPAFAVSTTEANDALTKAKLLVDGTTMTGDTEPQSVQYWLNDEDTEMVVATISASAQEIARAGESINLEGLKLKDYEGAIGKEIQRFTGELAKYQAEMADKVADVKAQMDAYQATQQDAIQVVQGQVANAQNSLAKWSGEQQNHIAKYTAKVGKEVQEYQAKVETWVRDNTTRISEYQATVSKLMQKYQADVNAESSSFQANAKIAGKNLDQAGVRLQIAQAYASQSQQDFQKSSTLYNWAINELTASTGASSAPPPQQAAQRAEEQRSTA